MALHGSWNRSIPDGYRVVSLHWENGTIIRKDFLSGFELNSDVIGRPVDVTQGPDGAVYISDDYAGAIYRMSYGEEQKKITAEVGNEAVPKGLQQPPWLNPENKARYMAKGEALFQKFSCGSCHRQRFRGSKMDLSTLSQRLHYAEVLERLTKSPAPMPTFPLSEEDKKALAVWMMEGG